MFSAKIFFKQMGLDGIIRRLQALHSLIKLIQQIRARLGHHKVLGRRFPGIQNLIPLVLHRITDQGGIHLALVQGCQHILIRGIVLILYMEPMGCRFLLHHSAAEGGTAVAHQHTLIGRIIIISKAVISRAAQQQCVAVAAGIGAIIIFLQPGIGFGDISHDIDITGNKFFLQ